MFPRSPQLICRICGFILGFVITSGGREKNATNAKLFVANHVSVFDCLVLESIQPVLQPYACCHYLPSYLCWMMDYVCDNFSLNHSLDFVRDNIEDFPQPILTFPEETTTSGTAGLLKFNSSYTNLTNGPVQPIALFVSRPSTSKIAISLIKENFWIDLFWTMFVPFTHYHISFLPLMTKLEEDSDEDFAKKLQRDIAYVLDIAVTPFSAKDKEEYYNKLNQAIPMVATKPKVITRSAQADKRIEDMTKQVKDVFPQCPVEIIKKDILRTKDVNLTLTNILEGRVTFEPLTEEQQEKERNKARIAKQQVEKVDLSQETGYLSFQEKKKRMIAEARRKYLEKYPEFGDGHLKKE